jgi:hypothetical protein
MNKFIIPAFSILFSIIDVNRYHFETNFDNLYNLLNKTTKNLYICL